MRLFYLYGKKAQFFIVGAVIIAAVIVGISRLSTFIVVPSGKNIQNFKAEIDREAESSVIYALNTTQNANDTIENFSRSYVAYARSKMFHSQYLFLFSDLDSISVFAFGDAPQIAATMGVGKNFNFQQIEGDYLRAVLPRSTGTQVNVTFYGKLYSMDLKHERDFYSLVRLEDDRGVFVSS